MAIKNLRKNARGRDCMVRIGGVCNHNPETVVLAHLGGGGMGAKRHDLHGAWCCSNCHDALDGRNQNHACTPDELKLCHYEGVIRTQEVLIREGVL